MNNQQPINTGIEPVPGVSQNGRFGFVQKYYGRLPTNLRIVLARFYANKKFFWPITIAFAIIFLIIILGLLFGSPAQSPTPTAKIAATPFSFAVPTASPSGGIVPSAKTQLEDLKNQIDDLDLNQSRLQAPTIDYKITF